MFEKLVKILLLLSTLSIGCECVYVCPPAPSITPCSCSILDVGPSLHCSGSSITQLDINNAFALSRQHNNISSSGLNYIAFFFMSETLLTSFDLTPLALTNFEDIRIERNNRLASLIPRTNSTEEIDIKSFRFSPRLLYLNGNKLTGDALTNVLKFVDPTVLRELRLDSNEVERIDPRIFDPFLYLQDINLGYNQIKGLDSGNLIINNVRLVQIHLPGNNIDRIPSGGFAMNPPPAGMEGEYLFVDLLANNLTDDRINADNGLNSTGRTVSLNLGYNQLEILSEGNFKSFLDVNERNEMHLDENPLVCDQRMKWLKDGRASYEFRVYYAVCSNDPDGATVFRTSLIS